MSHTLLPVQKDIAYGSDPAQKLDIYPASREQSGGAPVVIWVHGGGWRNGDKDNRSGTALCKTWSQEGIVTVNLNYRLTPAVVHPAHIQDIAAGVAWVQGNIAKHGGNPRRLFLLGHSAGAHLVALVATNPIYLKVHGLTPKATLAGVMPIDTASYDLNATRSPLVRKMIRDAFGTDRAVLEEASPLPQARKNRESCPPFLIATAKQRLEAVQESQALDKALPSSKLILQDYPGSGQLAAHGQIAKDLMDLKNPMTVQLLAFVQKSRPTS
ncbi:alpha/beta hydrolase [Armatimonas rosea]|uniref:Acetyl esterase/lipase n=1 Tax=Armatimonas rosea TaxID=685828 RepID=A0A7W9W3V8_ARMRO|nr:alpha/beta hydrolase [Armatimonas rosea]MBB6048784.1 acetyl esterase/lipase [Armatimonas rosea]